jgi:protein-tyrosine phosphatase
MRAEHTAGRAADAANLIATIAATPGRHIQVPGMLNLRDVGGYPVAGGGHTAWRRLLRSDGLHRLDDAATGQLGRLGLKTVIDLRTSAEAEIALSPVHDLAEHGALTLHISLLGADLTGLPGTLAEIYDYMVDGRGSAIGAAVQALSRPGALPALVHCTAGKDRTGLVVAFALAAVDVPDPVVAADYALSSLYLDPQSTPVLGQLQTGSGLSASLTAALLASPPELILRALDRARQHAGSVAGYLAGHGVSPVQVDNLRAALVVDGEAAATVRTFD